MNTSPLERLGFTPNEAKLYVALLKQGKATAATLSRLAGLNRTTVYSVCKALKKRGIITEDLTTPVSHFVALPLQDLRYLAQQEEKQLQEKKKLIEEVIDSLEEETKDVRYVIPRVVFITEEEIEAYLYRQTPVWTESLRKNKAIEWGFQDPSFVEHYQAWIDWYWRRQGIADIRLCLLSNQAVIEEEMKERRFLARQIKFWQGGPNFLSTIWISGDYVTVINTKTHPFYLLDIRDVALAYNLRELFKKVWESVG